MMAIFKRVDCIVLVLLWEVKKAKYISLEVAQ
jgi:hypothetical protein